MQSSLEIEIRGVKFHVEYSIGGFNDEAEIEECEIFVGGQEVTEVLEDKVLKAIDAKIYEEYWESGSESDYAEDDEDR